MYVPRAGAIDVGLVRLEELLGAAEAGVIVSGMAVATFCFGVARVNEEDCVVEHDSPSCNGNMLFGGGVGADMPRNGSHGGLC